MKYPRLRKHLVMVPVKEALTIGSSENTGIEIEDKDGIIWSILNLCDGTNTIASIYNKIFLDFPNTSESEIENVIDQISAVPYIMEDGKNDKKINDFNRHSRNLNFLSNFDRDGNQKYKYLEKIINSNVMVLGLGGAGTNLVYNLASFGVKNIIGVDFDTIEISNLNRQILYREKDIGRKKVEAAKESIYEFNSNINFIGIDTKIESKEEIRRLLEIHDCDFLFCAADKPSLKILEWCNSACHTLGIPWSYSGMTEYVSKFHTIIPGQTSCYECLKREIYSFNEAGEKYDQILHGSYGAENDCILANSSLLAAMLTFDVIKILAGINHSNISSVNQIVKVDHFTNEIRYDRVSKHKKCIFCNQCEVLNR